MLELSVSIPHWQFWQNKNLSKTISRIADVIKSQSAELQVKSLLFVAKGVYCDIFNMCCFNNKSSRQPFGSAFVLF